MRPLILVDKTWYFDVIELYLPSHMRPLSTPTTSLFIVEFTTLALLQPELTVTIKLKSRT